MSLELALSALGAGLLSFFSPCVLPLLPVYVGMLTTDAANERLSWGRRVGNTVAFVLGICCVFVLLGMGAGVVGVTLGNAYLVVALGILVFVFGLSLLGFVNIPALAREHRVGLSRVRAHGTLGSFLLGLAFSFGWTPCVGPILGTILALAAGQGSVGAGAALLFVYSLGLCIPFVVVTLAANLALARLKSLHRFLPALQRVGGVLIAVMGLWLVFGQVHALVSQTEALCSDDEPAASASAVGERAGTWSGSADGEAGLGRPDAGSSSRDQAASSASDDASLVALAQGAHAGEASLDGISGAWRNVVLTDLDGEKHRLSEYVGKPLYFEFWGSWCTSCVADLGQLNEVWADHEAAGDVTVVSVVTPGFYGERSQDDFVAWARENGVQVPVLMDTKCSLTQHLAVNAFPTSVFVNSDGTLVQIRLGALDRDELEQLLATLH